jgi:hypothetical protein
MKLNATSGRTAHRCISAPPSVPKNKSWIGKKAPACVEKSQLAPGMTQTQRLRLSRTNPKLLHELEAKEAERKCQVKAAQQLSNKRGAASMKEKSVLEVPQERDDLAIQTMLSDNLGESYESRENTSRHRRPVPTPRTSKMLLKDRQNEVDFDGQAVGSAFTEAATKTYTVLQQPTVNPKDSSRFSTNDIIQFTRPSVQLSYRNEQEDECPVPLNRQLHRSKSAVATQQMVLEPQHHRDTPASKVEPAFGQTRSLSVPVVAKKSSAPSSSSTNKEAIPDDSEPPPLLTVDDLGLRMIVEHYSGDSSDDENDNATRSDPMEHSDDRLDNGSINNSDDARALEPNLRKVMDIYSDDSVEGSEGRGDGGMLNHADRGDIRSPTPDSSDNESLKISLPDSSPVHQREKYTTRGTSGQGIYSSRSGVVSPSPRNGKASLGPPSLEPDVTTSMVADTYSEAFETLSDDEPKELKYARDAKVVPDSKLGYTWT